MTSPPILLYQNREVKQCYWIWYPNSCQDITARAMIIAELQRGNNVVRSILCASRPTIFQLLCVHCPRRKHGAGPSHFARHFIPY